MYRARAQLTISSETTPRLSSQSKKPSPASPDHSVPSQSKTANCGFRLITESIKEEACAGEDCFIVIFWKVSLKRFLDHRRKTVDSYLERRPQRLVVLGRINVNRHSRIV